MIHSQKQVEQEMQKLIEAGASLGDALRAMFQRGYGKLLLCEPLMSIAKVDSHEAKRIVTREIGLLHTVEPHCE